MKILLLFILSCSVLASVGCDVQSEITKKSVEKYGPTPTPDRTPVVEDPIDPADVLTVDTASSGPQITVLKSGPAKVNCDKFNKVVINGDAREIEITGACKQLMINGDGNKVKAGAVSEIVYNGTENSVQYSKFVNGRRPLISENAAGNETTKTAAPAAK